MKKETFTAGLLAAIMLLSLLNIRKLNNMTNEISFLAARAIENALSENWGAAVESVEKSIKILEENETYLNIILHHSEIDALTSDLYDLLDAVYSENLPGTRASTKLVTARLKSINSEEAIRLGSIF